MKTRSHLKKRILVQDQGGAELQPAGILKYVEDLKRGPNTKIGEKDFFEIASSLFPPLSPTFQHSLRGVGSRNRRPAFHSSILMV